MAVRYAVEWSDIAESHRKALAPEKRDFVRQLAHQLAADIDDDQESISRTPGRIYWDPATKISVTYDVDPARRVLRVLHVAEPLVPVPPRLFISYSHKDRRWLEEFRTSLSLLEDQQIVRVWSDTEIDPGDDWLKEIEQALGSARVAVSLMTMHFWASKFIKRKEVPPMLIKARDGGCVVTWVAVSTVPVEDTPFAHIEALNDPGRPLDKMRPGQRNDVFTAIYRKLKKQFQARPDLGGQQ